MFEKLGRDWGYSQGIPIFFAKNYKGPASSP